MFTDYQSLSPQTRCWVYASDKPIPEGIRQELLDHLHRFVDQWTSHQQEMPAFAEIRDDYFIILYADESSVKTGGCSIDASTRFIRQLGDHYGLDFFDRLNILMEIGGERKKVRVSELEEKYSRGEIKGTDLVLNQLARNKQELETQWKIPLQESQLWRLVQAD